MAHKIAEQQVVMPWEQDDVHDLEIGMGVDLVRGVAYVVFDRYTRTITLDESQLRDLIQKLERQADALRAGRPPGQ
jgi:hypothetical protein